MYQTFISILFAFILGLLLLPVRTLVPFKVDDPRASTTQPSTGNPVSEPELEPPGTLFVSSSWALILRGLLMLGVIISLWWWYSAFLARVQPTRVPVLYCLDFITMTAVALSAKLWPDDDSWIWASIGSIILLLARLCFVAFDDGLRRLLPRRVTRNLQRPQNLRRHELPWILSLVTDDKKVVKFACFILIACLAGAAIFVWGMSQRPRPQQKDEGAKLLFIFFESIVALGVAYTFSLAFFLPEGERDQDSPPVSSVTHLTEPPDRLLPVYGLNRGAASKELDELRVRLAAIRAGRLKFVQQQQRARRFRDGASAVHSTRDLEVQAFAMGLRFEKEEDSVLVQSAYLTYFIHWIDDVFDAGAHRDLIHGALQRIRIDGGTAQQLLSFNWATLFRRGADQPLVDLIAAAIDEIGPMHPKAAAQFQNGLHLVAVGAVLLNLDPSVRSEFAAWLLHTHAAAYRSLNTGLEWLTSVSDKTLAFTSKPAQDCWDAIKPEDDPAVTPLMNMLLVLPVFWHNSGAEEGAGEIHSGWGHHLSTDVFRSDLAKVNEVVKAGALVSRRRQLLFIRSACDYQMPQDKDYIAIAAQTTRRRRRETGS